MDTFEKIRELASSQLGIDKEEITLETRPSEDLDADSLDLFQLLNDIETTFGVTIDEYETELETVGDIVEYVEEQKNASKHS